jgi:hypothetical protein
VRERVCVRECVSVRAGLPVMGDVVTLALTPNTVELISTIGALFLFVGRDET